MLKKRKWLIIFLLLIALIILAMVVLSLIPGKQPGRSILYEIFIHRPQSVQVSELNFDVGRGRAFAHSNGSVAAVGTLGLQVLGPDGRETLRDSYRMSQPALSEKNGRFIAYDIGGTAVRVFSHNDIFVSLETEGVTVSASINNSGWFCVVTQEQAGGIRGAVTVYDNGGKPVFKVSLGSSYVLTAGLSDDNQNLALLSIAEGGSRLTLYTGIDTDKDPDLIYELGNEIFLDIQFISHTQILAVGMRCILKSDISADDTPDILYSFDEHRLGGYTHTGDFIALHLYDFSIGHSGQVISIDYNGDLLGRIDTAFEIFSVSSFNGTLVLLGSNGITFYNQYLDAYPVYDNDFTISSAGYILALSEDTALASNGLSAFIIRRDR